jgi:hypothetical protein
MSKVISFGIQAPDGPPPIGARERCPRCDAMVEVEPKEPFLAGIFELGALPARAGWLIRCGACNYSRVFIKVKKPKKAE